MATTTDLNTETEAGNTAGPLPKGNGVDPEGTVRDGKFDDLSAHTVEEEPQTQRQSVFDDLDAHKIDEDDDDEAEAEEVASIRVRRPPKKDFIRFHPTFQFTAYIYEDEDADETYYVAPAMRALLKDEASGMRPIRCMARSRNGATLDLGALLRRLGITDWVKTEKSGRYYLEKDYFKDQCRIYPRLEGLRQLKKTIRLLQEPKLSIGTDGRNRAPVAGFGAESGRNAPKASKFLPLQARCMRGMIRPSEGMALAYIDWEAQEIAIAAALSRDPNLMLAYQSGDPYLFFAKMVGLVPADATKSSHGTIREICKTLMLSVNYGMSALG
jgi:hypothetical protein